MAKLCWANMADQPSANIERVLFQRMSKERDLYLSKKYAPLEKAFLCLKDNFDPSIFQPFPKSFMQCGLAKIFVHMRMLLLATELCGSPEKRSRAFPLPLEKASFRMAMEE
ncbi:hypothetical protein M513_10420 [Trichuris suis]|uniref:Uncharacterized protein n=1 Tax=Trichuris suis TaxID=68888 RepID=A0A085LUR3_9BILA|nr:hypothetical protein M513_10420 [Trichuris suis]